MEKVFMLICATLKFRGVCLCAGSEIFCSLEKGRKCFNLNNFYTSSKYAKEDN